MKRGERKEGREGRQVEKLATLWDDLAMSDLEKLTKMVVKFRSARDWKRFHNPDSFPFTKHREIIEVEQQFLKIP